MERSTTKIKEEEQEFAQYEAIAAIRKTHFMRSEG